MCINYSALSYFCDGNYFDLNIVLPRITNIGFGILSVKGNIRRPWPAANIMAVLGISTSEEGSCSMNIKSYRSSLSHFQ